jgi:hypothetical protein
MRHMPENINPSTNENRGLHWLITCGSELAGGTISGALSFLAGGIADAALFGAGSAGVALALRHIGMEASERHLGPREAVRVGGVLAIAAYNIRQRVEAGENVRSDGFFQQKQTGRPDAEEVAESVLLKSQREPEEKKISYMGYLLSNIAFNATISAQMAHQVTKAAEQLTYRQFCLLKLAVGKNSFGLRNSDYRGGRHFSKELYQVLYEILDLYHRGFINLGGEVAFGPTDVPPAKMTVQGLGVDIYNLLRLVEIPNDDLLPIAEQLK